MDPLRFEPNPIGEWGCYWDPEGPIGYGKTKAKALSDLFDQCDDADGHAQDMLAGAIVAALVRREEYDRANPLGGPASMFRVMAERIEAGEAYAAVLADYGVTVGAPPSDRGSEQDSRNGGFDSRSVAESRCEKAGSNPAEGVNSPGLDGSRGLTAGKDRQPPLRLCGYCHAWKSRPCGEGCQWSPDDPTVDSVPTNVRGFDKGRPGGDMTAEVEGVRNADGSVTITKMTVSEAEPDPDRACNAIEAALRTYRCKFTRCGGDPTDSGLPLVDMLTPASDSSIKRGEEELVLLAEHLYDNMPPFQAAYFPPGPPKATEGTARGPSEADQAAARMRAAIDEEIDP